MKRNVRRSVFETNSSSTHSLCIVPKEEFEKFKKGKLIFDNCKEELVEITEEIKKKLSQDEDDEDYDEDFEWEYQKYENLGREQLETFERNYKTKKGDEIVAFGCYGQDG